MTFTILHTVLTQMQRKFFMSAKYVLVTTPSIREYYLKQIIKVKLVCSLQW